MVPLEPGITGVWVLLRALGRLVMLSAFNLTRLLLYIPSFQSRTQDIPRTLRLGDGGLGIIDSWREGQPYNAHPKHPRESILHDKLPVPHHLGPARPGSGPRMIRSNQGVNRAGSEDLC